MKLWLLSWFCMTLVVFVDYSFIQALWFISLACLTMTIIYSGLDNKYEKFLKHKRGEVK